MPENNDEVSLKELLLAINRIGRYLRSKWIVFLVWGIIGGGLGLLYSILKAPTYTGTITFVLSNENKTGAGLASLAGQFGLDMGGSISNGAFEGENIVQLLKSRRIVKGALFKEIPQEKEVLLNIVAETSGFFKGWKKDRRLSKYLPFPKDANKILPVHDSLINVIHEFLVKKYLRVEKVDKKLSFYLVSTTSPSEIASVYLTRSLVDEASKMYIGTKTKAARENLNMLQFEADSLRNELGVTIYSSASQIDQTFNLNPALQKQRVPIQRNQVQAQVLGTAYGEVIKNLEIAKITLQKETPLYQIIDEPSTPLTRKNISKPVGLAVGAILTMLIYACYLLMKLVYIKVTKP